MDCTEIVRAINCNIVRAFAIHAHVTACIPRIRHHAKNSIYKLFSGYGVNCGRRIEV